MGEGLAGLAGLGRGGGVGLGGLGGLGGDVFRPRFLGWTGARPCPPKVKEHPSIAGVHKPAVGELLKPPSPEPRQRI